jgi:hypothetical protein
MDVIALEHQIRHAAVHDFVHQEPLSRISMMSAPTQHRMMKAIMHSPVVGVSCAATDCPQMASFRNQSERARGAWK